MKPCKNIDKHDLSISFDFWTYSFPMDKTLMVEDKLFNFLHESFPLSFNFNVQVAKNKAVAPVRKTKTKAFIKTQEGQTATLDKEAMYVQTSKPKPTFGGADLTPPDGTVDKDGVGWYGEGIEIEGGTGV